MIRHIVFFSARDKADIDRIVRGLSVLAKIPHSLHFEVGRNMKADQISSDIDVIVYGEFADEAALAAFKARSALSAVDRHGAAAARDALRGRLRHRDGARLIEDVRLEHNRRS